MKVRVLRCRRETDFKSGGGTQYDCRQHIVLDNDPWIVSLRKYAREHRLNFAGDLFLYVTPQAPWKRVLGLWVYRPDPTGCWGLFNDISTFYVGCPPPIHAMADTLKPASHHAAVARRALRIQAWAEQSDNQQNQDRATEHNQWLQRQTDAPMMPLPYEVDQDDDMTDRVIEVATRKTQVQVNCA